MCTVAVASSFLFLDDKERLMDPLFIDCAAGMIHDVFLDSGGGIGLTWHWTKLTTVTGTENTWLEVVKSFDWSSVMS